MNFKRNSLYVLAAGVASLLLAFVPIIALLFQNDASVGIIGGADISLRFVLWQNPWIYCLISLGISLIISSLFCLLFQKMVKTYCSLTTSGLSLALSAVGALLAYCAMNWFVIVAFNDMSAHPIAYPGSIALGILSFFGFLLLVAVYLKKRSKNWSIKGFLIDVLTSIVYFPTFILIFSYAHEIISSILYNWRY